MTPRSLLSLLALLALLTTACCSPTFNNQCYRFVEGFPVRLKQLRGDYLKIRDFFVANITNENENETPLLDQSVEDSFKSPFGCHAMTSILDFYLGTVLPTALDGLTEDTRSLRPHMESIQQIFDQLKRDVIQCKIYFSCKKPFHIGKLTSAYTQMESNGLYKAMDELDLLFNYIEVYLTSNSPNNAVATA